MSTFAVGHRVIVAHWKYGSSPNTDMTGYYGHVVELHPRTSRPMVSVDLIGRVGAEARELDLGPDDPWIFYADELEHAD